MSVRNILAILGFLAVTAGVQAAPVRGLPRPLPSHPGNIFLADETVMLPLPAGASEKWQVVDYDRATVTAGEVKDGQAKIGKLPVGYYELHEGTNVVFFGVLEPLHAPTPLTSPIGIDVGLAWFAFTRDQMERTVSLCQLAGMNRVRDRISWPELEPKQGEIVASNRYDASLDVQKAAGLQVLDVNHASPTWANPDGRHFARDLRDVYHIYFELAKRWRGKLEAFEPWNEADLAMFGGHTGNEMASFQKAAYFGMKAGNPDLTVCENVFAIHRLTTLRNFNDNHAWPYFDTFNVHHYDQLTNYPKMWEDFRASSAGRPMWVSECNVTVDWADEKTHEPSPEDLRVQSERVPRIYAEDIFYGASAVFYFMLPDYVEYKRQYGLLHGDQSPRPGYLALAAAGRLLADAKALGRLKTGDGVLFSAKPDGTNVEVLLAWAETETELELPKAPVACFDHLGRTHPVAGTKVVLNHAPQYFILAKDGRPPLAPTPPVIERYEGKTCPIVMQLLPDEKDIVLNKSAYRRGTNTVSETPVYVYNLGKETVKGKITVTMETNWTSEFPQEVEIAPGERKQLTLKLKDSGPWKWDVARVGLKGDFGAAGKSFLAVRFAP